MENSLKPDAAHLLTILQRVPAFSSIKTWWLAYSGGVDSRVLLHLLTQLNLPVRAVYVDHGLQAVSRNWAEHCRQTCASLNIPFTEIAVNAQPRRGESPEAAARHARYQALSSLVETGHCVLTAQHADDQAETFLLQLMRGAGAAGLSAMPFVQAFHLGWLVRPLLEFSRQDILQIANDENLVWVEDPSNADERLDRNYLRRQIVPLLTKRWPQSVRIIAGAAQQQAENQLLLEALAAQDLFSGNCATEMPVENIMTLDESRQRNALRYWLEQNQVRMPSRAIMQQIISQLLHGRNDARSCVRWDNIELHRYCKQLYLLKAQQHDATQKFFWDGRQPLRITALQQNLILQMVKNGGLNPEIAGKNLCVRFRQGGEKIKPVGQKHTRTLKNLLQQQSIPPWQRERIPLLYLNDELIAVCGYWLADAYAVKTGDGLLPVLVDEHSNLIAAP